MKLLIALLLVVATILPAAAVTDRPVSRVNPSIPLPATFRFTVFGDFRPARAGEPYPPQFRRVLDAMAAAKPAFAVSTGDAWFGYGGTMARYRDEVQAYLKIVRGWEIPLFGVIGNHEATGNAEREGYLREQFGHLYGSFDFGDAHFIVLDSEEVGAEGRVTGEQLRWLERDLELNRGASALFVFLHRPLFSVNDPGLEKGSSFRDRANRDALHRLFVRYRVRAVFAGHEHLFDQRERDGVRYYITGGGGAPLYAKPAQGGFFHYLLVTVEGGVVSVEVRKLEGDRRRTPQR